MLVFISDLHFVDETAGKHNIPASAFEKFLTNVKVHADKAKAKELKIVFLGDIFDILRTEEWFKEEEVNRPWGNNTANWGRTNSSPVSWNMKFFGKRSRLRLTC